MDVEDRSGKSLSQIDVRTSNARHVIRVENISSLTQNTQVFAKLPNLTNHIEFVDGGTVTDNWNEARYNIASGTIVTCNRPVQRNTGPNNPAEPIQCDDVQDSVGSLAWSSGTSGVPFSMTIAAN
jgi:hypothetical protein